MTQGSENLPPAHPAARPDFLPPQGAVPQPAAPAPPPAAPPPSSTPPQRPRKRRTFLIALGAGVVVVLAFTTLAFRDLATRASTAGQVRHSTEKPLVKRFPANPCEVVQEATAERLVPSAETLPTTTSAPDPRAGCRWLGRGSGASAGRQLIVQMTAYQDDTVASGADTAKRELADHRALQQKHVQVEPLPGIGHEAFAGHTSGDNGSNGVLVMFRTGNTLVDLTYTASDIRDQALLLQEVGTAARDIAQYLYSCSACG